MGHYAVKEAICDRLEDSVAGWLPEGFTAPTVAIADVLPRDETKWPTVLVQTTRMTGKTATGAVNEYLFVYNCQVTVGTRDTIGDRDEAALSATESRDTLLEAVRNALLFWPALSDDMRILVGNGIDEDTSATPEDSKGRAISIGSIRFDVQAVETIPPPADTDPDPEIETATVDVAAVDADSNLPDVVPEPEPEPEPEP